MLTTLISLFLLQATARHAPVPVIALDPARAPSSGPGENGVARFPERRMLYSLDGADGIYLFNFFTTRERQGDAFEPPFEVLRDIGDPKSLQGSQRGETPSSWKQKDFFITFWSPPPATTRPSRRWRRSTTT